MGADTNGLVTDEMVSNGSWYHIAGTYNGNNLKIYIDGNLSKGVARATDDVANSTLVRVGSRASSYYFDTYLT